MRALLARAGLFRRERGAALRLPRRRRAQRQPSQDQPKARMNPQSSQPFHHRTIFSPMGRAFDSDAPLPRGRGNSRNPRSMVSAPLTPSIKGSLIDPAFAFSQVRR